MVFPISYPVRINFFIIIYIPIYSFNNILVTLKYRDQLTNCLLACILLTYWLLISTYEAHILHDHIYTSLILPYT